MIHTHLCPQVAMYTSMYHVLIMIRWHVIKQETQLDYVLQFN